MATKRPRARDLGIPFEGQPGPHDAITDVPGVEVGHATLVRGEPGGDAPVVRTGVTVVHPAGKDATLGLPAGRFALNGTGEMTGTTFLDEIGLLFGPVAITNTLSVGTVRDAIVEWTRDRFADPDVRSARALPVVGETWDGKLNDVYGLHVTKADARRALEEAAPGPVAEGSVGGGTGMTAYEFKAGIGTASRVVATPFGEYTLGVLVQANYGKRHQLRVAGLPVGRDMAEPLPPHGGAERGDGSIIVVVATDAPLLPSQTRPLAKRAALGLARNGSIASHTSGDLFLALSTAQGVSYGAPGLRNLEFVPTEGLDPFFAAAVEATEEAIVNALVAAEPMTGVGGAHYPALPHERLREILRRHGRLVG